MSDSKQYSHKEVETKWMKQWLDARLFETQINEGTGKFSIALPPPNVTGELHMGHALGGTVQDLLIRYNRMLGKDVLWQIGTDHAGIGTQLVVEKHLKKNEGKRKEDLGREKFIERTQAWKEEYGNKIIEQMKLLGFSPDYNRIRYTMDDHYANAVKQTFIKYFNDELIYRGNRLVNWCPKCLTSLSDLEIDKEQTNKKLYDIKYFIKNQDWDPQSQSCKNPGNPENYLIVSTTRPETMFGDTAVAINPNDDRYSNLTAQIRKDPGSVTLLIPLSNKEIPLILDEHVKLEFGTGAMKVTPAHDANDYEISLRHDLPKILIMDQDGKMSHCKEVPEELAGLDRYSARDSIVESLSSIIEISEYPQEKDLHDRCGTEIEPYLSDQWYVAMPELAKLALDTESSGHTTFIPERYNSIFKNWLENIQDWCISRQIWWGHRIPVYHYDDTPSGANLEDLEKITQTDKNCYINSDTKLIRYYAAEAPRDPSHKQDEDVLDTWFSSAIWPYETLKSAQGSLELNDWDKQVYQKFYPTDVLATARDIINLWVSRMIYSSQYFKTIEPFKHVLVHPVVQTPDGKRMSKSKGNAIDPLELVEKYGADASRMWYTSVGIHGQQDVKFPGRKDKSQGWLSDQVEQYRKFANKLFNAAKFVMMQLDEAGFKPEPISKLDTSKLNMADIWILDSFTQILEKINQAYNNYDLGYIQKALYEFLWFDFCDWYIELTKVDSGDSAKQILFYILEASLRALHPIMPFITEEIWQQLRDKYDFSKINSGVINLKLATQYQESISFAQYPQAETALIDKGGSAKQMSFIINIVSALRNARQSLDIAWSKPIRIYYQSQSEFESCAIDAAADYISKLAKAEELSQLNSEPPKPASINLVGETQIIVPLSGLVDLEKLKNNIEKKINKIEKDINVLENRLNSDNFVKNAAPEKVEEARKALEESFSKKDIYERELEDIGV